MRIIEAIDAAHAGEPITCTADEYRPHTGLGIRNVLFSYALHCISTRNFDRAGCVIDEIKRLDTLFSGAAR